LARRRLRYANIGGLVSYRTSVDLIHGLIETYTGRILKGEKRPTSPVAQPTKFGIVIDLATAKALASDVPPALLSLCDPVIE
jgi:putative ABC transport system substrate-binding protein